MKYIYLLIHFRSTLYSVWFLHACVCAYRWAWILMIHNAQALLPLLKYLECIMFAWSHLFNFILFALLLSLTLTLTQWLLRKHLLSTPYFILHLLLTFFFNIRGTVSTHFFLVLSLFHLLVFFLPVVVEGTCTLPLDKPGVKYHFSHLVAL